MPAPAGLRLMRGGKRPLAPLVVATALAWLGGGLSPAVAVDKLYGEGESWPVLAVQELVNHSSAATAPYEQVYLDSGETTARQDVASGLADWAVTSVVLSDTDRATATANGRTIAYAPYMAGAVAVVVALDVDNDHGGGRLPKLTLNVLTLAKLFTHNITRWNDPEIVAQNPDQPNLNFLRENVVEFVARKDTSSSTSALIAMFLADPEARVVWNNYVSSLGAPVDTPLDAWPDDPVNTAHPLSSGSKGMVDYMLGLDPSDSSKRLPGATSHYIGYLAPAWATKFNAPMVTLASKDGAVKIDPTPDAVRKAVAEGTVDPDTNTVTLSHAVTASGAYPATLVSFLAVPTTGLAGTKPVAVSGFVKYAVGDEGQSIVAGNGYVPIDASMREAAVRVADQVAAQGQAPAATTSTTSAASTTTSTTTPLELTTTTVASTAGTPATGDGAALSSLPSLGGTSPGGGSPGTTVAVSGRSSASAGGPGRVVHEDLVLPLTGSTDRRKPLLVLGGLVVGSEVVRRFARRSRAAP